MNKTHLSELATFLATLTVLALLATAAITISRSSAPGADGPSLRLKQASTSFNDNAIESMWEMSHR